MIELYGVFESALYAFGPGSGTRSITQEKKLIGFDYHADWVDVNRLRRASSDHLKVTNILKMVQGLKGVTFDHGNLCDQFEIPVLSNVINEQSFRVSLCSYVKFIFQCPFIFHKVKAQ